jgi:hypothetical protein
MPGQEQAYGRSSLLGRQGRGDIAGSFHWDLVDSSGGSCCWGFVVALVGNGGQATARRGRGSLTDHWRVKMDGRRRSDPLGAQQATVAGPGREPSLAAMVIAVEDSPVHPEVSSGAAQEDSWGRGRRDRPGE